MDENCRTESIAVSAWMRKVQSLSEFKDTTSKCSKSFTYMWFTYMWFTILTASVSPLSITADVCTLIFGLYLVIFSFQFANVYQFFNLFIKKVQDLICWLDIKLNLQTQESEEMLISIKADILATFCSFQCSRSRHKQPMMFSIFTWEIVLNVVDNMKNVFVRGAFYLF